MSHFRQGEKQVRPNRALWRGAALLSLTLITTAPLTITPALAQKVQTLEPATTPAPANQSPATQQAPAPNNSYRLTPAEDAALQLDYELLQAAYRGETHNVRAALAKGASIETRDGQYGFTPLMYAASQGHLGTVRYLISKGAKVNARSKQGVQIQLGRGPTIATETVEHQGQLGQMNWFPVLLCESGAISPLMLASAGGYNLTVRELLAHGADPNYRNPDGDTALMYATFKGYLPSIQALLARGARVNDMDRYGQTALTQAAWTGSLPVARLLLSRKARVNIKARNGWTPVEYARAGGHNALARVLRQAAAREPKIAPTNQNRVKPTTQTIPNSPVPAPESVNNGSIIIVR